MPRAGKYLPERTCVACRKPAAKSELVRLVRCSDQNLVVDAGGRLRGRGAYVCRSGQCLASGVRSGQLERALRIKLDDAARQALCGPANKEVSC